MQPLPLQLCRNPSLHAWRLVIATSLNRYVEDAKGRGSHILPACQPPYVARVCADCTRIMGLVKGEEQQT